MLLENENGKLIAAKKAIGRMFALKKGLNENVENYKRRVKQITSSVVEAIRDDDSVRQTTLLLLDNFEIDSGKLDNVNGRQFVWLLSECAKTKCIDFERLAQVYPAIKNHRACNVEELDILCRLIQECGDTQVAKTQFFCRPPEPKGEIWNIVLADNNRVLS